MKTERQMFEDYINYQQSELQRLEKEILKIKKDINAVTELMAKCPYENSLNEEAEND
jgi:hypothetical protein